MPGLTKQAKKAYEKAKTIKALTKKNNIADLKKKKKKKPPIGLRLPEGFKNIIDHGPEYA
jgi:hypothetical protein